MGKKGVVTVVTVVSADFSSKRDFFPRVWSKSTVTNVTNHKICFLYIHRSQEHQIQYFLWLYHPIPHL